MNSRLSMLCVWSGVVFMAALGIGMCFLAQFIPPHSPTAAGSEIAAIYQASTPRIRLGLFFLLFGACFYIPWTAVITQQIKRIEGSFNILSCIQLASGALTVYMFTLPTMIWATTAFRPDRNPDLTLMFNDFGWMMFVGMFSPFFFVPVSVGAAALIDKSPEPAFPRWCGYLSLWAAVMLIPGALLIFFKSGPFAWDGVIAFWLPLVATVIWFIAMVDCLRKAIRRQAGVTPAARAVPNN